MRNLWWKNNFWSIRTLNYSWTFRGINSCGWNWPSKILEWSPNPNLLFIICIIMLIILILFLIYFINFLFPSIILWLFCFFRASFLCINRVITFHILGTIFILYSFSHLKNSSHQIFKCITRFRLINIFWYTY